MVNDEDCKKLVQVGFVSDVLDIVGDILPFGGVINKFTDYQQINLETATFNPQEFQEYKDLYWLPDSLRAYMECYMKSTVKRLPKLPLIIEE